MRFYGHAIDKLPYLQSILLVLSRYGFHQALHNHRQHILGDHPVMSFYCHSLIEAVLLCFEDENVL